MSIVSLLCIVAILLTWLIGVWDEGLDVLGDYDAYPTIEIAPIVIISITNTIDLALIPSNTIIPSRNTGMSHRK